MNDHYRSSVIAAAFTAIIVAATMPAYSQGVALPDPIPDGMQELFRIRIENKAGGTIGISTDGGARYIVTGKVLRPAATTDLGHSASVYAHKSAISAVAVHGIRIRIGDPRQGDRFPRAISIVPREFRYVPIGYGGHVPGDSGIYTDIPSGQSIFRNLAPRVDSPVYLELGKDLLPIPDDYMPKDGDAYVISVQAPLVSPAWIEIENWKDGKVIARMADGTEKQIATVTQPVLGVGRFDGTSLTGTGRINTVHCGVVTISTAPVTDSLLPEGKGDERRGGFMIQPIAHAETQPGLDQVMIIAPLPGAAPLEGAEPMFASTLGLPFNSDAVDNSYVVDIKIDNGPWEAMPILIGRIDDAFTAAKLTKHFSDLGTPRQVTSGVTNFRIHVPAMPKPYIQQLAKAAARTESTEPPSATNAKRTDSVSGVISLKARVTDLESTKYVLFYVDGALVGITNSAPYHCDWDTTTVKNGEHSVEVVAVDDSGSRVTSATQKIWVDNGSE